jgi:RNA polymerase subunit RPABC4/transcription elongation factor Spt4
MTGDAFNNIILATITLLGAGLSALWLGMTIWTWQDMGARSRDPLARIAATLLVLLVPGFGLVVYLMLRPRETLADAYERSLEEEALLQEIEEKPACPGCGRPTQKDWQVCPYCHTRLKKDCVNCHQLLELTWNLCPYCATSQIDYSEGEASPPQRRSIMRQLEDDRPPYEYNPGESLEFVDE